MRRGAPVALVLLLLAACAPATPPGPALSVPQLKERVFAEVGRPWYCDPDFYPLGRGDERAIAVQRFPEVQRDPETFQTILRQLGLAAAATDDQKLAVYREWKQLNALQLASSGGDYSFTSYRVVPKQGETQGALVTGSITSDGRIGVGSRVPAGPPNCPICLADDVRIATPSGDVLVTALHVGDAVWTLDASGRRVAAPVAAVGSMPAPAGHEVVDLMLADGRVVRVSPGHPLVDGRRVGDLAPGDVVDGARVVSVAREPYAGATHDLLPAGATGAYWANGVLLASTLR